MKKHLHKIKESIIVKHKDNLKGLISLSLILIVGIFVFNFVNGDNLNTPHKAELNFTEHSFNDKSKGSVIPASCNAAPPDTHSGAYTCTCPTGQEIVSSSETAVVCQWQTITLNCDYGTLSWKYNEPAKSCITCAKIKTPSEVIPAYCRRTIFRGERCFPETTTPATYYTAATQAQCPNTPPEVFVR